MKNWCVISKPIKEQSKGLSAYLTYLVNAEHSNHKSKTKIVSVLGNIDKLYKKIIYSVAERDLTRSKKRKGGRPCQSYAQSYVFTLPENLPMHPTYSDWRYISVELLKTIQAFTGASSEELKNNVFINFHDQKNPHLNIVVSKVMHKSVQTVLQKKSIVTALKKTFNFAVLAAIKLSPDDYTPLKKRSKRYNEYQYQQNKLLDSCDDFIKNKISSVLPLPENYELKNNVELK
jgi:hypothetical protein